MRLLTLGMCLVCASVVLAQGPPPPGPAASGRFEEIKLDAAARTEIIDGVIHHLNDNYVYPEMARKMEAGLRERVARGDYDRITHPQEFAIRLTNNLFEVGRDRHLRVSFSQDKIPIEGTNVKPSAEQMSRYREQQARQNFGFPRVELLEGNIGYLDVRSFDDPALAADAAAAAMNFLQNTDALVIDIRNNTGGDPAMVALLCSYFFGKKTHLNDIFWRPDGSTKEFWTLDSVAGKRYLEKPIWVLTSKQTFSGGEEFAYDLKTQNRGTIVGAATAGGSHPTMIKRINDHFRIAVPAGRAINPMTKSDWEGTGVQPDISSRPADALRIAHAEAAKKLAAVADSGRKQELEDLTEELEALGKPAPTDDGGLDLPATPAGKGLRAYLLALNSGNLGFVRLFLKTQNLPVFFARSDYQVFQKSGGFKVHSILKSSDHNIEVLVQRKKDSRWQKLIVKLDSAEPHFVRTVNYEDAAAPSP